MKIHAAVILCAAALFVCGQGVRTAAVAGLQTATSARLTNAEQRRWNTYFSNFSEVYVEPFERGKITENALIEFGIRHNMENNQHYWTKQGLAPRYVEASVMKFFGRKITHHHAPAPYYPYKNGYYDYPTVGGEGIAFSQVTGLHALSKTEYRANVTVYVAGNGWEGDPQASMPVWRRADPMDVPTVLHRMRATVRKETSGGEPHYILLDYREVKE